MVSVRYPDGGGLGTAQREKREGLRLQFGVTPPISRGASRRPAVLDAGPAPYGWDQDQR